MIQVYCGDGKGKTTAAIGQLVRAAGNGWKVCFSQFMKGNDTGELEVLRRLSEVTIYRSDKNFGFYSRMTDEQKKELTDIHNQILNKLLQAVEQDECRMIVLDEVTYPVTWGLLSDDRLKQLLKLAQTKDVEVVITGRNPADFMLETADYITEMKAVRHPYEKGVTARKGIEY